MLSNAEREEIKQLITEVAAESDERPVARDVAALICDLIVNEGFTELTFVNPMTGEKRVLKATSAPDALVDITARAIEVFGTREGALRWLKSPVRSLGDATPLSLLSTPEGILRIQETLGRVEHGIW